MLLRTTDPFRDLDRLTQQIFGTTNRPAVMPMDAWREGDRFVIEFDLPGVARESIDLDVERNAVMASLHEAGVSSRRGIMAAHLEPAYAGHPCAPLPVTEKLTSRSIILPLYHQMTEAEQDRVIEAFLRATSGPRATGEPAGEAVSAPAMVTS